MRSLIALLALALVACPTAGSRLREHTYPPTFQYIEQSHLQSSMWVLASEVQHLDRALRHPAADAEEQRRQVADVLIAMQRAVDGIATPGRVTQHPLLNRNLPRFREQVQRARTDVARTPPSYFTATTLVGSCSACHGSAES